MGNWRTIFTAVVITFGVAGCTPREPSVVLRYDVPLGTARSYDLQYTASENSAQDPNGFQGYCLKLTLMSVADQSNRAQDIVPFRLRLEKLIGVQINGQSLSVDPALAKKVEGMELSFSLSGSGQVRPGQIVKPNRLGLNEAMLGEGMGLNSFGFLDLHYPAGPVKVGDQWKAVVLVARRYRSNDPNAVPPKVLGECTYRLEKLPPGTGLAVVTGHVDVGDTYFASYGDMPSEQSVWYYLKARWTIDIKTGLPTDFLLEEAVTRPRFSGGDSSFSVDVTASPYTASR